MRNTLAAAVVVIIHLFPRVSSAQDEALDEGATEGLADDASATVDEGTTEDGAAPEQADASEAEDDAEAGEFVRFRWGISGMGGPLVGGVSGGIGGLDLRFGAQISELLGIYLQPVLLVGAGVDSSATGASASALAMVGAGVLADFTFIDLFYAAIGPELVYGGLATSSTSAAGSTGSASGGTFFSLATRLGIALGSKTPERRKALTLGLDMHIIFVPGSVVVAPMIALGYDKF